KRSVAEEASLAFPGREEVTLVEAAPIIIRRLFWARDITAKYARLAPLTLAIDQALAEIHVAVRQALIARVFRGDLTDEEREETLTNLQRDADSGLWPDPEADIAVVEAQVNALPPAKPASC